jgi:hypothetical protein
MNELRDELRSLADRVDLPPTTAAEGAWEAARSRYAVGGPPPWAARPPWSWSWAWG